ncbi:unnamed protein product, partial [marine sediment metagenome]
KYFDIIIQSFEFCRRNKNLQLFAFVILDDHFHLIASALDLSNTITSLKKFIAKKIIVQLNQDNKSWLLNQLSYYKKKYKKGSDYQVWQEGIHPQSITTDKMLIQKIEYIHYNPVKRGLVDKPEHWRYSSARNYLSNDHSIIKIDEILI